MPPFSIPPGKRSGKIVPPYSKSHLHRLLIADFLSGSCSHLEPDGGDSQDILATKSCLRALAGEATSPVLDCGESGSTLRFLAPVAAALGKKPVYAMKGRLAERPGINYGKLESGLHVLPGNVSSQFVTGLLFALPLLDGDSEIRLSSPLESKGYVDLTLSVLEDYGIEIKCLENGYSIKGGQRYRKTKGFLPERDWSGAAFWIAMNTLGSNVSVMGLNPASRQPDRAVEELLSRRGDVIDMAQAPDLFPALAVTAAAIPKTTLFTSIKRLRIKESDRVDAMARILAKLGADAEIGENGLSVRGVQGHFNGGVSVKTENDHRIAMAAAVAASYSIKPIEIDDASCTRKSYPGFFSEYMRLG